MAILVSKVSGGAARLGNNWVPRFLHRHPEVHTKIGIKIDALRLQTTTPAALEAWFTKLQELQAEKQVDTADIWNMDEIGTALGVCTNQTVVGSSSITRSYKKSPENREWVSTLKIILSSG